MGYTIVLMSAEVFDPSEFDGIAGADVCAVQKGKYMYCTGRYATVDEANRQLNVIWRKGVRKLMSCGRNRGYFIANRHLHQKQLFLNSEELKEILNF